MDPGELGGLNGRVGDWNAVPRWSGLPCSLLPGSWRSQLQLLQSCPGECPSVQARADSLLFSKGSSWIDQSRGQAPVLWFILSSRFPGQLAHSTEQTSGQTLPDWCPLPSWLFLPPYRLRDF